MSDTAVIAAPWSRQPGETSVAWEAFVLFRDWGTSRNHAKVYRKLGKSRTVIERWSRKWNWLERAHAWDEQVDSVRQEAALGEVAEMAKRHIGEAGEFIEVAMAHIRAFAKSFDTPAKRKKFEKELVALPPKERVQVMARMVMMWELAVKQERLARGEPTENIAGRIGIHVVDRLARKIGALATQFLPADQRDAYLVELDKLMSDEIGESLQLKEREAPLLEMEKN